MVLSRWIVWVRLIVLVAIVSSGSFRVSGAEKPKPKPAPKKPAEPALPPPPIEEVVALGTGGYLVQAKDKLPAHPFITEHIQGPLPTNDWCTSVLWEAYSSNHFAHPLAMRCDKAGLRIGYPDVRAEATRISTEFKDGEMTLGHSVETAFPDARLDGYSDWFVRVQFKNDDKLLQTTYGHGSPFVYVRTQGGNPAVRFAAPPTVWQGKAGDAVLGISVKDKHYALFGVPQSKWKGLDGTVFENEGAPENYISVALLPEKDAKVLELFQAYAFNEIVDTAVAWEYIEAQAMVETTYTFKTHPLLPNGKPGTLFALYPHQWLNCDESALLPYGYNTVRGPMKLGAGNSFKTHMRFDGILPVVPGPARSPEIVKRLNEMLTESLSQKLDDPGDSYWAGKPMDQLSLLLPIAQQAGNKDAVASMLGTLKQRLETWFTVPAQTNGKKERYFCYNKLWGALTGQNTSYGSELLNDHHFHYGYFIRAAAEVARLEPDWAKDENYGAMVKMLIRDIASPDRKDPMFAFLRSFDIYAGHSWAGGSAINSSGNNQESISEAINAWTGIYLWGMATHDKGLRDLGAFLYTQEVNACECYWFDVGQRVFPKGYQRSCTVLVFNGSSAYATWFSGKPEHCHGILLLPIQPGSFYLGRHPEYVRRNIDNVVALAGNENLDWMEFFAPYLALIDPEKALKWFDAQYPKLNPRARPIAFQWITALQTLGQLDTKVTADYSAALVFNKAGKKSYVAYNYGDAPVTVTFSDGKKIDAPKGISITE